MPKRKRVSTAAAPVEAETVAPPPLLTNTSRRVPARGQSNAVSDPTSSLDVLDGDADVDENIVPQAPNGSAIIVTDPKKQRRTGRRKAVQEDEEVTVEANGLTAAMPGKAAIKSKDGLAENDVRGDQEADDADEPVDPEEIKQAMHRPPPVNSDYLPLPWRGRLGYACLCTYLRNSNPPVFSSRTTRIASILEHRHPLKDPSQPEHPTKNRPDKDKPADIRRGQRFVEHLCLANVRDMIKMMRWNDKFNIKFFRLSSEAFPFASHAEYGYKLAPFAADALAEVGKVAAELGHRLTTHPGQFTQLGSPRKQVIDSSIRDLEYHDEMLSLLNLPEQQNRDAVMVLHMGGTFGSKPETLDRFRENYARLSPSIKNRLVLENDDVCWSVHDLLPICKELNIPFVLDFHHHNIVFDAEKIREGTKDIIELFPEIRETWTRKGITQKMHYSEPTPAAITGKQRRKHSPRVATLPPCPPDMDLMIEAKDKEQAVFELMRTFKLPGYDTFNDIIPYVRDDDNKSILAAQKKATPRKKAKKLAEDDDDDEVLDGERLGFSLIPEDAVGMGGVQNRVYWPPTMEEWLRPVKRIVQRKGDIEGDADKPTKKSSAAKKEAAAAVGTEPALNGVTNGAPAVNGIEEEPEGLLTAPKAKRAMAAPKADTELQAKGRRSKKAALYEPEMTGSEDEDAATPPPMRRGKRGSAKKVNYAVDDDSD